VAPPQFSVRCFGVLGASFVTLTVACQTTPDVVATKRSDAGASAAINLQPGHQRCEAGRYEGHMNTVADGGASVPFSADINFSLVQTLGGEIYHLKDNSILSGNNENGSHFTAEINGGNGCAEGNFNTQLLDGKYWITSDSSSTPVPFEGTIAGTYTAEFHGFNGNWSTTLHINGLDLLVSGRWSANYAGPVAMN
jgi:hypothetical protein